MFSLTTSRRILKKQYGFGALAVLIVLILLSALAIAMLRLSIAQSMGSAADVGLIKAMGAARSGMQWGAYQVTKGSWSTCSSESQTLDLRSNTDFSVTVSCTSKTYNEGETSPGVVRSVRVYSLRSVACNGSGASCPDTANADKSGYIEREIQAVFRN